MPVQFVIGDGVVQFGPVQLVVLQLGPVQLTGVQLVPTQGGKGFGPGFGPGVQLVPTQGGKGFGPGFGPGVQLVPTHGLGSTQLVPLHLVVFVQLTPSLHLGHPGPTQSVVFVQLGPEHLHSQLNGSTAFLPFGSNPPRQGSSPSAKQAQLYFFSSGFSRCRRSLRDYDLKRIRVWDFN
jgi:hypothetical protein